MEGRSRKTLSGRKFGCGFARAERVMEDIEDIIAPVNSDEQKGFVTILHRRFAFKSFVFQHLIQMIQ